MVSFVFLLLRMLLGFSAYSCSWSRLERIQSSKNYLQCLLRISLFFNGCSASFSTTFYTTEAEMTLLYKFPSMSSSEFQSGSDELSIGQGSFLGLLRLYKYFLAFRITNSLRDSLLSFYGAVDFWLKNLGNFQNNSERGLGMSQRGSQASMI